MPASISLSIYSMTDELLANCNLLQLCILIGIFTTKNNPPFHIINIVDHWGKEEVAGCLPAWR